MLLIQFSERPKKLGQNQRVGTVNICGLIHIIIMASSMKRLKLTEPHHVTSKNEAVFLCDIQITFLIYTG